MSKSFSKIEKRNSEVMLIFNPLCVIDIAQWNYCLMWRNNFAKVFVYSLGMEAVVKCELRNRCFKLKTLNIEQSKRAQDKIMTQ